ncbi:FAD-dependent oxidoreductase [Burkholderiaceae bacterium DAT-1]|nr:FAD-dependent oxidoreductase [Burkholderiaceae bacterium DAT-1]
MNAPLVIIGTGLAGYNLAREYRKHAPDAPLLIITADAGDFYSKPMISNALAGNKSAAQLAMKSAEKMAEELKATVLTHTRVESIDRDARIVRVAGGEHAYSQLVLALGADPIDSGLQGDRSRVISVNDLADYARLREMLEGKEDILVIGAGLIGCEFANDLSAIGKRVQVVDPSVWPLSRLLPQAGGERLKAALEGLGVTFHLGTTAQSVALVDDRVVVTLANGETVTVALVLSAIGLRPRIALAQDAGLATNRGIKVDRHLRTSDPAIFALGDCAEVDGQVLPFVMPIMQAMRALAATLAGNDTRVSYPAMPVVVKTPACPTVVSPAAPGSAGEWVVESDAEGLKARFMHGDLTLGFALMGKATAERAAMAAGVPPVLP